MVEDGASIGFLPPMKRSEAIDYWGGALNPDVILFVAKLQGEIVGSVQLHLLFDFHLSIQSNHYLSGDTIIFTIPGALIKK